MKAEGRAGKIRLVSYDLVQSGRFCREGIVDFVIDQDPVQEGFRALTALHSFVVYGEELPDKRLMAIDVRIRDSVDGGERGDGKRRARRSLAAEALA